MITLTEEQFKEMIEAAHRAGQHNQGHCDPSAYEAMVYYEREVKKLIIPDVSGSSSPDDFWKQEYDEAVKEIGNLQDQLKDAESAIRDMESELRSRY